jgi:EAL domain-containing protein (putative c-di-GMP-specific phosphodiesterase class I)
MPERISGGIEAQVLREEEIKRELVRIAASEHSEVLYLQYQPILDLRSNRICGFEALARLRTDKSGPVPPAEFIQIAEKTKLIVPIGEMVITDALRFLNRLTILGYKEINVSVNVSAIQLLRPEFTDRLLELITEMRVNPANIGIEITESIFASDYSVINGIIRKLKDIGLYIAIDDFGTGYSSLAREKELNVNCLKIDKYFIDKLLEDDPDKAITGDIISMAHRLGHYTIAEGVEYEEQKQYLLAHGCDKVQGYLISRPLDEEAAVELLKNRHSI